MGQNLFEDTCARLESVQNYTVYILSTAQNATIVNLIFKSIVTPSLEQTSITVEFDEIYLINELKLEGLQAQGVAVQPGKTGSPFSYVIDVCKDEFFRWTRIVDYSNLSCYSTQQLYFPKWAVKYVRFTQTKGHEAFTLRFASCSYASSVAFQYRDGGIMSPISPFTPIYSQHLAPLTSGCYVRCFVTFNQPYSVSMIRFRMKEVTVLPEIGEIQVYLATQNKARHYQMVADLKDHRYDSELHVTFPERVVSIISITIPLTLKITNCDNALIQSGEQLERLLESVHFTVEDLFCQALQVP